MEGLSDWVINFSTTDRNLVTVGVGLFFFCGLGVAAVIWSIWRTRNDNWLKNIFPTNPSCVGCKVKYWMFVAYREMYFTTCR